MSGSRIAETEAVLAAAREVADERLIQSLRQARQLETETAERGVETGRRRIAQLQAISEAIAAQAAAIDQASAQLTDILATTSERLASIDITAGFAPPPWHTAIDETVARNLEPGV